MRTMIVAMVVVFAGVAHAGTKEACIAADTHAQELRRAGKLREALSTLDACTTESCPSVVRADCNDRVTEIRAAMPTVVFDVNVAETRVDMDGHPFLDRVDARPLDVDPGEHTFVLTARNAHETLHLTLSEGEKDHRVKWVVPEPPVRRIPPSATPRILGLTSGAIGIAGVVVGSVFGGLTIADHSTVTSACPNDVCPSNDVLSREKPANDESRTFGLASNVAFIAAAVFLGIGVVLYATAPRRPRIVVGLSGVSGSF